MPPAARVGDATAHPGAITGPGVATVLIGGMPAAVLGDPHACAFLRRRAHTPPTPIANGSATVMIGGKRRGTRRRYRDVRRVHHVRRVRRADRRLSWTRRHFLGRAGLFACAPAATGATSSLPSTKRTSARRCASSSTRIAASASCARTSAPALTTSCSSPSTPPRARSSDIAWKRRLITWEPRIRVEAVEVLLSASERSRADVRIEYSVRATNTFYNLVYPFYAREGGE